LLPDFIASQYPALGVTFNQDGSINEASSAAITYKLFSPIKFDAYTVTDADYAALGVTSLNNGGDYNDFFDQNFPSEAPGTVVDLTFNSEPTISAYTLTDADYDLVGNGRFDNFDIRVGRDEETIDARRAKIQTILLNNFPNAADASKYAVTYEVYDGSSSYDLELLVKQQQNQPNATLTTNYTLTEDDFDLVGNGNFDNFDIRVGRAEETVEARRAKIETILLNNFTTTAVGDLYNVTYAVWEGFDSTRVMLVEFNGTGYDIFNTTSYELYTYALEEVTKRFTLTDEWSAPITFTNDEYTLMGQRFPNFSDSDEAVYNIGIYLRTLYQFAAPDDFVAVEYNFFSGGVSQRNVNYIFDGSVWNAIPSVIDVLLKFGHDGTSWVPDNTIKRTFTVADVAFISSEFLSKYPGPAENLGYFKTFDVRSSSDNYWSDDMLLEAFNALLNDIDTSAEEEQKYSLTYTVYNGSTVNLTINLIKTGGIFVKQ
jgi:hypothetical protein